MVAISLQDYVSGTPVRRKPSVRFAPIAVEAETSDKRRDRALLRRATSRSHAVVMVQVFAVALMVFPSDLIIKAVGADGYPAILIAYVMLLAWVAATLFGLHNPLHYRYPVRMALWVLWLVSLISYALIDPAVVTPLERASADRWLMQLAGVSGVILVTAECLRSREDIRRVLRALTWGGAFSAAWSPHCNSSCAWTSLRTCGGCCPASRRTWSPQATPT